MSRQRVINLLGGPGTGKSIFCADIFAALKRKGINCEMAREYAKDLAWQAAPAGGAEFNEAVTNQFFSDQKSIFGEQSRRQSILKGKVDVIITDSPLLLSAIYDPDNDIDFQRSVLNEFNKYDNYNFYLNRVYPYESEGRYQDEGGAKEVDNTIKQLLEKNGVKYTELDAYDYNAQRIAQEMYTIITGNKI